MKGSLIGVIAVLFFTTGCGGGTMTIESCHPQLSKDGLVKPTPVYVCTKELNTVDIVHTEDVQQEWCEADAAPIGARQIVGHKVITHIRKGWVLGLHMFSEDDSTSKNEPSRW